MRSGPGCDLVTVGREAEPVSGMGSMQRRVTHTSCIYCGKLVFNHRLSKCPKCGGRVVHLVESDLNLLGRRPQPATKAPGREDY